jgi:quinol-cytochrome oxidoreductase complex cytochrome b subunit
MEAHMNDIIQAIKDVFATFSSLGWLPLPLAVATVTMLGLRIAFEPDVASTSTSEDVARRDWKKLQIFCGVAFITVLIQFGLQKPGNGFDRALAVGFTLADVMFAYVITSSDKVKGIIKSKFVKETDV